MPLHKALGLFSLTMYGIGIIIGAGVYALLGKAAGITGNSLWISFVIGAALASLTGLSYAELSSAYPKASAEANYLKHAFKKDWLAFAIGWLVVTAGFVSAAAVALGFAGYFESFVQTPIPLIAIALIVMLSIINFLGIETSAKINIFFTLVELAGVALIIILGIPFLGSVNYFQMENGFSGVLSATALIFFAYIGFEAIAKLGEETEHAKKIMPKALILSIAITSILYILLSISAVSIMPTTELSKSDAPLADIAGKAAGPQTSVLLAIIALLATFSTVLVMLIVTSRLLYGLGKKHELPSIIARVHKKTGTPYIAIIVTMLCASATVFFQDIELVANATTFMIFLSFFAVNIALIFLRYKHWDYKPKFRIPLNIGNFSIIAFLGATSSFIMLFNYSLWEAGITIGFLAIGFAIYAAEQAIKKQKPEHKKKTGWPKKKTSTA